MNDQSIDAIAEQEARPETPELEAAARETLGRLSRGRAPARAAEFTVSYYDIKVALKDGSALLFNSLTRSLILLSVDETAVYDALGSEPFPAQQIHDPLLLRALMAGGHIVGASKDEVGGVQKSYEATRASKNTMVLTIAPTMACNFACGYCFQGLLKPTKKMGREVQDAILTFIKAQEGLKGLSVVWYGGEPLMGRDSIYRLSDSLIADWEGYNAIPTAEGVGRATTRTVVITAVVILVCDFMISAMAISLG